MREPASLISRALLAVAFLWLSSERSSAQAGWDATVDITGSATPCADIQRALNPFLLGESTARSVKITGTARLSHEALNDRGDYEVCFGLIPATKIIDGYPDGRGVWSDPYSQLSIHFENVHITFDPTGQKVPAVIAQWGNFYQRGWLKIGRSLDVEGAIISGVRVSGRLVIETSGALDRGWAAGRIPGLPFSGPNMSRTTLVGWFETGLLRADMSSLSLMLLGNSIDADDIGFLHQHGWGTYRGFVQVARFGTGMLFYGNSVGSIAQGYVAHNVIGVALGDPYIGGDIAPSPECNKREETGTADYCKRKKDRVNSVSFRDMVIEGNKYGNLVVFAAENVTFDGIYFEMDRPPSSQGHGILIGAGRCGEGGDDAFRFCGLDSDCESHECISTPRSMTSGIRIVGGSIGGDRGNPKWDALVVGPGARLVGESDSLFIESNIGASVDGDVRRIFTAHPRANIGVDLERVQLSRHERGIVPPPYPQLRMLGMSTLETIVHSAAWESGRCLPIGRVAAEGEPCGSPESQYSIEGPVWLQSMEVDVHDRGGEGAGACRAVLVATGSDGRSETVATVPVGGGEATGQEGDVAATVVDRKFDDGATISIRVDPGPGCARYGDDPRRCGCRSGSASYRVRYVRLPASRSRSP